MKNIALEVMLYETMFKRASGFKILFTFKPEFKNYDEPFTSRLSFKNVSENVDGYQDIISLLIYNLFQQFFLAFHFSILICL